MNPPDGTRRYRKRKRARAEEATRKRITEAAVELHGTVGPANSTITEIAKLAGVSRATVYNHFPNDADLFAACSSHWAERNPPPDIERWRKIEDPVERLRHGLAELYAWYRAKRQMLGNVVRDAPLLPALEDVVEAFWGELTEAAVTVLAEGWRDEPALAEGTAGPTGSGPVHGAAAHGEARNAALIATLRVVVDYRTWETLARSGLDDAQAALTGAAMATGAAGLQTAFQSGTPNSDESVSASERIRSRLP